jgi:hypothetical protein
VIVGDVQIADSDSKRFQGIPTLLEVRDMRFKGNRGTGFFQRSVFNGFIDSACSWGVDTHFTRYLKNLIYHMMCFRHDQPWRKPRQNRPVPFVSKHPFPQFQTTSPVFAPPINIGSFLLRITGGGFSFHWVVAKAKTCGMLASHSHVLRQPKPLLDMSRNIT